MLPFFPTLTPDVSAQLVQPGESTPAPRATRAPEASAERSSPFLTGAVRASTGLGLGVALGGLWPVRFSCGHTSGGWGPYALAEAGIFGVQGELGIGGGMFAGCGTYRHFVTGIGLAASALHQWRTLEGDLQQSRDLVGGVVNLSYIVSVKPGLYVDVSNGDPLFTIAIGTGL